MDSERINFVTSTPHPSHLTTNADTSLTIISWKLMTSVELYRIRLMSSRGPKRKRQRKGWGLGDGLGTFAVLSVSSVRNLFPSPFRAK